MATEKFVIKKPKVIHENIPQSDAKDGKLHSDQSEGLFKNAKELLETFGNAKVGYKLFQNYAIEFQLKDSAWPLYYLLMVATFLMDALEALVIMALVVIVLIAFVYVVLRGVNAWAETVHLLHFLIHEVNINL